MSELTKLEERIKNRRQRRWKRRGRIIAPFAAIPLLLATLVLSVDIVEYSPQEKRASKESARATPTATIARASRGIRPSPATRAAIATSAVSADRLLDTTQLEVNGIDVQAFGTKSTMDAMLPNSRKSSQ